MDWVWILSAAVLFAGFTITVMTIAYTVGVDEGRRLGYRKAREIPIGQIERLDVDITGLNAVVKLRDDVTILPSIGHLPL